MSAPIDPDPDADDDLPGATGSNREERKPKGEVYAVPPETAGNIKHEQAPPVDDDPFDLDADDPLEEFDEPEGGQERS